MPSTLEPKDCRCPCHQGARVVHPVPCCAAVGVWKLPKRKKGAAAAPVMDPSREMTVGRPVPVHAHAFAEALRKIQVIASNPTMSR